MSIETEDLRRFFDTASDEKLLLVVHLDPDFDAIGSVLALSLALEMRGIVHEVWIPDNVGDAYSFLPGHDKITQVIPKDFDYSAVVALDCSNEFRITDSKKLLRCEQVINIDHHGDNSRFGTINFVPRISSVGELLVGLFEDWDWEITPDMATCLYAAIVFDTGQFKYQSVTPLTLTRAASLLALGVDHADISLRIFDSKPKRYFDQVKEVLEHLVVDETYKIAYTFLPNCQKAEGHDLIDFLRQVQNVEVYILFRAYERGLVKVSLRSKCGFHVSHFSKQFDGGGHQMAAGIRFQNAKLPEVVDKVISALKIEMADYLKL